MLQLNFVVLKDLLLLLLFLDGADAMQCDYETGQ